jgi:hypothetical protein
MADGEPAQPGHGVTDSRVMLQKTPTHRELPALREMLANLGNPSTKALARALGVSERTARSYRTSGHAPRPVLIALFWVTSWGQARVHVDAHNDARMAYQTAQVLKHECEKLRFMVNELAKRRRDECANDPVTMEGVSLRDRALLLRNEATRVSSPMRVTIPNATRRDDLRR